MEQDMLIHPGEVIKEEFLVPHGLNANQLAERLGVPANAITAIINGRRGVSAPMSKLLGNAFGMSEEFFANLQTRYEMDLATLDAETTQQRHRGQRPDIVSLRKRATPDPGTNRIGRCNRLTD